MSDTQRAFEEGQAAKKAGKPIESNPYYEGIEAFEKFVAGYLSDAEAVVEEVIEGGEKLIEQIEQKIEGTDVTSVTEVTTPEVVTLVESPAPLNI